MSASWKIQILRRLKILDHTQVSKTHKDSFENMQAGLERIEAEVENDTAKKLKDTGKKLKVARKEMKKTLVNVMKAAKTLKKKIRNQKNGSKIKIKNFFHLLHSGKKCHFLMHTKIYF